MASEQKGRRAPAKAPATGGEKVEGDGSGQALAPVEENGGEQTGAAIAAAEERTHGADSAVNDTIEEGPQPLTEGATAAPGGAPEEDHVTAFERQMERLVRIVDESDFETGSLRGDIRDTMLDVIKSRPKPWSQMSELEQRDLVRALDAVTTGIVKKAVFVMAEQDDLSVHATLKGYSADGGTFKLKLVASGDMDTAKQLYSLDGHEVVLISADSKRFQGARKEPQIDPDQPGLKFSDQVITSDPPAKTPEDDTDLSGGGEPVTDLKTTRVNLVEGTVEDSADGKTWSYVRDATPEELAAVREAQADFQGDE
jgi:hypothetical protein